MNRTLRNAILNLKDGEGLTLKNGNIINYKSGWQVATEGKTTGQPLLAYALAKGYNGTCGIWLENGVYYVDKCHRVNTKKEALEVGRAHQQISVYGWKRGNLAYC